MHVVGLALRGGSEVDVVRSLLSGWVSEYVIYVLERALDDVPQSSVRCLVLGC